MSKYIIKNCPCFDKYGTQCYDTPTLPVVDIPLCQNCTDCVMKCIKSKLDYLKCYINNDDSANLSKMNEIINSILKLLDIQEINE